MEPTLSEIQSYKGDANIAGGTAGEGAGLAAPEPVQFDQGIQFLNEAASARAAYNKYLSDHYSTNLNNTLTNLRNIDFSKAMASDLPALRQKYAALASNVADNFDVIRNPASNLEKSSELTKQEADLRSDIAMSENHNAIGTYNKNFIAANPTFNTPTNQAKIANFQNKPMDERTDFLLDTPTNFDLTKVAQLAAPYALKAVEKEQLSHDGKWITTTEGQQFVQDAYHKAALAIKNNTIVNGQTLNDAYLKDYSLLPDHLKNGLSPDDAFLAGIDALAPQTSLKTTFKANPYGEESQRLAGQAAQQLRAQKFEADQNDKNRALQVKLLKKGEIDPNEAGEAKLRTLASAFTSGNLGDQLGQQVYGDNSKINKTVKVIGQNADGSPLIETNKIPVPLIQFKGSSIDDKGNLHIHRFDNATNQPLPDIVRSYNEAYSDFDKLYGDAYAPQIGSATATYSQKNFKKPTPTLEELRTHFNVPNVVTNKYDSNIDQNGQPFSILQDGINKAQQQQTEPVNTPEKEGTLSDEKFNNLLRKNGLIK